MVYVFFANGFEEIEALAPVDILRRAELEVVMVGVGSKTITGSHGITVACDMTDAEAAERGLSGVDMLVLPGGMPGTLNLEKSASVSGLIDSAAEQQKWLTAICAAPSILGHKKLLRNKKAICFPGYEDQLSGAVIAEESVVQDGKFITAKGAGVAIEFGLKLVECLISKKRADLLKASLQCRN